MKTIKLSEYGAILTGREFGSDVMKKLKSILRSPVILDFEGVESMGSSFGDEVVPPIAHSQNNLVSVINANNEVKSTLNDIAFDANIEIKFL